MKRINRTLLLRAGLGLVVAFGAIQLIPVAGVDDNPPQRYDLQAPADVKAALQAACYDCHSNETKWPWYSRVAPISWRIAAHVDDGRAALNFSEWGDKAEEDRQFDRENVWEMIDTGVMPLSDYLLLHPEAVLSDEQKLAIQSWSQENPAALQAEETSNDAPADEADDVATAPLDGSDGGAGGAANAERTAEAEDGADPPADDPSSESDAHNRSGEVADTPAAKTPKPGPAPKPSPAPKPAAPPSPATPKPAAPKPKPDPPAAYDGPNPCRSASFTFSNVRSACQKGGVSQAKSLMKYLVKKAKDNGTTYKCSSCHSNQKTYTNKSNANADFRKMMEAAK